MRKMVWAAFLIPLDWFVLMLSHILSNDAKANANL